MRLATGVADRERRMTYFEPRVGESVYGATGHPSRWHRCVSPLPHAPAGTPAAPVVEAMEMLRLPQVLASDAPRRAVVVLHMRLSGDPLNDLPRLRDLTAKRAEYAGLLPAGVRLLESERKAWVLSHITFDDGALPEVMPPPYTAWGARDQWLWLSASATPVVHFPPDPEDDGLFAGRVRLSADWQALVLRDGAAFIGTSPDSGDGAGFHPTAASLVHTIYLDAFLLGRWQVLGVNFLANSLARLPARQAEARRLLDLERKQIELRRALWSSHITVHGNANTLLERFQEQHRLPGLLAQAGTALADAARYVETARARRSGLAVGLLSTIGLPFAVAYAAGALWGEPGPKTLLYSTLAALAITVVLFLAIPAVRGLASAELRRPEV
ncbi:hypothetical protein GCM10010425_19080 [Streptomyces spororaveus]|uniref:CorA-like Mg2+ transporter protein n=2 Tax=Streptomyces TaxID=1883 RepID=A0ABQ3T7L5_9ACTN|nr:hypothetical protein Sspor_19600 [Streptomyces spororaveus]